MSHAAHFRAAARRLVDPASTDADKLRTVTEISERLEIVHTSEYGNFLK